MQIRPLTFSQRQKAGNKFLLPLGVRLYAMLACSWQVRRAFCDPLFVSSKRFLQSAKQLSISGSELLANEQLFGWGKKSLIFRTNKSLF